MQQIYFTQMVDLDQGDKCGGYTHELIYLSGPRFNNALAPINADLTHYTLDELSDTRIEVAGVVEDFSWLGTHTIQIKATNGREDLNAAARGNQGFFNSVLSPEIQVEISNPCLISVVNSDEEFAIEKIDVSASQVVEEVILSGPRDSTSIIYGNGYNMCGALTYQFINSRGDPF